VADPADLTRALSELTGKGIQALVVLPDGMFLAQAAPIVALTAQHRLPTIYGLREYVPLGGLMAYGADIAKMHRQFSASLVDRILRGAKPGDLPIEQPTEFDLVINLRTAKTLGVTIPPLLLAQADQVIQ
jgi:putative ABC transport system substrate-binding protein